MSHASLLPQYRPDHQIILTRLRSVIHRLWGLHQQNSPRTSSEDSASFPNKLCHFLILLMQFVCGLYWKKKYMPVYIKYINTCQFSVVATSGYFEAKWPFFHFICFLTVSYHGNWCVIQLWLVIFRHTETTHLGLRMPLTVEVCAPIDHPDNPPEWLACTQKPNTWLQLHANVCQPAAPLKDAASVWCRGGQVLAHLTCAK